jgi:hypothetical protein
METKQIEVDCPHCSTRILVDVRTGQVLRSLRPEQRDAGGKPVVTEADWEGAMGRVRSRETQRDTKLDTALQRERDKSSRLDDLFREASEKLAEDGETP